MTLVRLLYNLAFPFVLVAMLPGFVFRMIRRGKYRHKFGQRFGIYSPRVKERLLRGSGRWTWVHAVSVGEVLIALKFIQELKAREPGLQVLLSTTTSTGFGIASQQKSDWLEPIYNPVDFLFTVRRAVRMIRPRRLILVEAEVWPNLTAEARAVGAKLSLVNARLSQRSERRYRLARPIVAPVFNQLDLLCVQEEADAMRWQSLGVEPSRIVCTGSIKFDDAADVGRARRDLFPDLAALGVSPAAPVILAGSTHSGEEELLGRVLRAIKRDVPDLFYLCIPRHAERWREVKSGLEKLGWKVAVRAGAAEPVEAPDALLANTTGELRDWFDCATVVFIGKSLLAHGGQNPAEAVAAGKAVIVGPYMENFSTLVAQFVRAGGVVQVRDEAELERAMRELLADPARRKEIAARGVRCLQVHRGATARTCEALASL